MAKRFTDSTKWEDAWFQELEPKHKLFWVYLLDKCDHAGIWKVNFRTASFFTDTHLEYESTINVFKLRITEINKEYWLVNKFIPYQYNKDISELNPNNNVHLSVLNKLNSFIQFKPLVSPLLGAKDKDKDKYKEKAIEKAIDKDNDIDDYSKWYDWFMDSWNASYLHYKKKTISMKRLTQSNEDSLKYIVKTFGQEETKQAMVGLMMQKSFPGDSDLISLTHFLKDDGVFIDKYLMAYQTDNKEIYKAIKKFE